MAHVAASWACDCHIQTVILYLCFYGESHVDLIYQGFVRTGSMGFRTRLHQRCSINVVKQCGTRNGILVVFHEEGGKLRYIITCNVRVCNWHPHTVSDPGTAAARLGLLPMYCTCTYDIDLWNIVNLRLFPSSTSRTPCA